MTTIIVPERFNPSDISAWIAEWREKSDSPSLQVDFSNNIFCSTGGIAMLASCLCYRRDRGLQNIITINEQSAVFRYLQRIDFFNNLGVKTIENFVRHDVSGRFVSLKSIITTADSRNLAKDIMDFIEVQVNEIPTSLVNYSRFILEELGINIVQHAEAGNTGFGLGQAYTQNGFVECAYSDYGIGIYRSLTKNLEFLSRIETDAEAIRLALEDKVSCNPDQQKNAGAGLYEFERICGRMSGEFWIASGGACIHKKYVERACNVDETLTIPRYDGTWVCFRIPLQQNR